MENNKMTIDEKLDAILANQVTLKRYAKWKVIFSGISFFFVIVVPLLLLIWAGYYIQDTLGLTGEEMSEMLRKAKTITDFGGIEGLKQFMN